MAKNLLIVESPSKAKTIGKYLGKNYIVQATVGHIRDLPKKELGVDVEQGFEPKYITIRGKGEIIKKLKASAKSADKVLIATDPDREGEAIAFHIMHLIDGRNDNVERVLFNEITKSGIKSGLESPRSIDTDKVNAQQARRIMDRLVGYKVSPILWKTIRRGLSAGRVQSVALRLICEREDEIIAFIPEEYWSIAVDLKGKEGESFSADLLKIDGEKIAIGNEKTSLEHQKALEQASFNIANITQKEVKRQPVHPFTTSTLQQDAARRLRLSPKKSMMIAQQLYEGVDIKGEPVGLITYMRTDSTRIASIALDEARSYISSTFGDRYLPEKPRVFRQKKGAQDAHEAIRPTNASLAPDDIKGALTQDQFKLYDLIWRRFTATQMANALFNQTSIKINAGERYEFSTTGSIRTFDGFLKVYPDIKAEGDTYVPEKIQVGEDLKLLAVKPEQHFTKPPARFSESLLIRELDKLGIGRPSTYSQIISTLYDRTYVDKIEGRMAPSELGQIVKKILIDIFPNIFNVEFTARMENEFDKIESGDLDWRTVLNDFYEPFKQKLEGVTGKLDEIKESIQEKTGESCELCGKPMIIKWSRNGRFQSCSGWPDCKNAKPMPGEEPDEPQPTGEKCDKCKTGDMVVKRGRFGQFLACSNYPECKNTKPIPLGVQCPQDGGDIIQRRTKKGRYFYGCSNYPKCDFAIWQKPVPTTCPTCEYPFMVQMSKDGEDFLLCQKCKTQIKKPEATLTEN